MAPLSTPLPVLPPDLLRRHHCLEPTDTRFRAMARLRQSLWREQHGFPCGRIEYDTGRSRRLGSRLTAKVARTGVNLIDPALVPWARRQLAYCEVGALIEADRFWGNLLASQPLTFSLFGPMQQDLRLATAVFRELIPDLVDTVTDIALEHSPGAAIPASPATTAPSTP